MLANIDMPQIICDLIIEKIKEDSIKEDETKNQIILTQEKNLQKEQDKIKNLINMRASNELSQKEYLEAKREAEKQKIFLEEKIKELKNNENSLANKMIKYVSFVADVKEKFEIGSPELKRDIIQNLGSNLFIINRKADFYLDLELKPFENEGKEVKENYARFEPHEISIIKAQNRAFDPALTNLWALKDSNLGPLRCKRSALTS